MGTVGTLRLNEQPDSELEQQVETASNGAQQKTQHIPPDPSNADPKLARLIELWSRLTEEERQAITDQAELFAAGRINFAN